ncbi:unnamed protein product [Mytilus edulis]|uniref:Uncharacterized protein n=1 Tax=Mytilus edulis TaxID=6550 RepID=A0A8S3UCB5_MYTED|nr:unnamed protein product [Mytilus edulis]
MTTTKQTKREPAAALPQKYSAICGIPIFENIEKITINHYKKKDYIGKNIVPFINDSKIPDYLDNITEPSKNHNKDTRLSEQQYTQYYPETITRLTDYLDNNTVLSRSHYKGNRLSRQQYSTIQKPLQGDLKGQLKDIPQITSGSKGEGVDIKGSDFDIMYIDQDFVVYESENDAVHDSRKVFVMDNEDTQPCYTYLQLHSKYKVLHYSFKQILQQHRGKTLLSSERYKLHKLSLQGDNAKINRIHGPCLSDITDDYDLACCLKCDQWVTLKDAIQTQKLKLMILSKTMPSLNVIFAQHSPISPVELKIDVMKHWIKFNSIQFAHFLSFLCCYHRGDISSCLNSMLQFKGTAFDSGPPRYTLFTYEFMSLGISAQMLGNSYLAKLVFSIIAEHDKYNETSAAYRLRQLC